MGNTIGKVGLCFTGSTQGQPACMTSDCTYYDEGLGHSFCYVRPGPARFDFSGPGPGPGSSKIHSEESAAASSIFRSISGASVSANTSTPPSTAVDAAAAATTTFAAAVFESSTSFASAPLQPIPRSGPLSGPISSDHHGLASGPMDRSGGFMSGPLERAGPLFSGPLDRSLSVCAKRRRSGRPSLMRGLRRVLSKTFRQNGAPTREKWVIFNNKMINNYNNHHHHHDDDNENNKSNNNSNSNCESVIMSSEIVSTEESDESLSSSYELTQNLQWAQGKAGEDRVHVVVSEERGWVFVGIYDGFNGPDATDFLLSNLYVSVQKELKGLLWDDHVSKVDSHFDCSLSETNECSITSSRSPSSSSSSSSSSSCDDSRIRGCASGGDGGSSTGKGRGLLRGRRRWKCEWDRERVELDRRLREQWGRRDCVPEEKSNLIEHGDVLEAMSRALRKTEESYLDIADKMLDENPELALMGSCVVAMLMKGEDVYVVNVGDSRAVLAQSKEPDLGLGMVDHDLERINEESLYDIDVSSGVICNLRTLQLTVDHSTSDDEEVQRIRDEHPDDVSAVVNDRVKGSLKVTRAFGAGFLKQKKWNDALLEMFRIDYVGNSPYINCLPFLYHHRLGPKDQFLILSSDGLYQYFTNEEAVAEVELFISLSPEGDPAQHLVEEVLFRAAKRAGLDFYELLEIPQGDRRRYHDDVSIIVISFEGRIWRSCV
ncbi:hypothetical protein vseg_010071 [Gypsophila vaccaria]